MHIVDVGERRIIRVTMAFILRQQVFAVTTTDGNREPDTETNKAWEPWVHASDEKRKRVLRDVRVRRRTANKEGKLAPH